MIRPEMCETHLTLQDMDLKTRVQREILKAVRPDLRKTHFRQKREEQRLFLFEHRLVLFEVRRRKGIEFFFHGSK